MDAAESDVAGGVAGPVCLAGGWAVAVAVGGCAQVGAALDDEPVVLAGRGVRAAAGRPGAGLVVLAGAGLVR